MPNKLRKSPPMKESQLVKLCLDWLRAEKILAWRSNTGAMSGSYKGKRWFVRFGERGMPDIMAITPIVQIGRYVSGGQAWGIECKTSTGKQSEEQFDFERRFECAGGRYLLVRSLEDLKRGLGR